MFASISNKYINKFIINLVFVIVNFLNEILTFSKLKKIETNKLPLYEIHFLPL